MFDWFIDKIVDSVIIKIKSNVKNDMICELREQVKNELSVEEDFKKSLSKFKLKIANKGIDAYYAMEHLNCSSYDFDIQLIDPDGFNKEISIKAISIRDLYNKLTPLIDMKFEEQFMVDACRLYVRVVKYNKTQLISLHFREADGTSVDSIKVIAQHLIDWIGTRPELQI